jgi:hypothetical protein
MMGQLGEERLQLPVRIINKRRHQLNIFHSLLHTMKKTGADEGEDDMLNLDEDLQEDSRESVGNLDYTIVRALSKEEEQEGVTTHITLTQLMEPTKTKSTILPSGKDYKITLSQPRKAIAMQILLPEPFKNIQFQFFAKQIRITAQFVFYNS